jgi:hypothetical protein
VGELVDDFDIVTRPDGSGKDAGGLEGEPKENDERRDGNPEGKGSRLGDAKAMKSG